MQALARVGGQDLRRQAVVGADAREEALGEQQDVLAALPERRQSQGHHREPMVQVLPERRSRTAAEIRVRGAMIQTSAGSGRVPPRRRTARSSMTVRSFACSASGSGRSRRGRWCRMRGLEEAGLGLAGVGECPALEAEQLGLEQRLRDRRAVDVHELPGGARTEAVDEPGDETLAGPGLALQEDRREPAARVLASRKPPDRLPHGLHCGARPRRSLQGSIAR